MKHGLQSFAIGCMIGLCLGIGSGIGNVIYYHTDLSISHTHNVS